MKVKNYGELSELILNEIKDKIEIINQAVVGDSYSPASTVIELDLKVLLHKAIMNKLGELGSINNQEYEREGYNNGLAIDLVKIDVIVEDGRLFVFTKRGEIEEE